LAIAQQLEEKDYDVEVYLVKVSEKMSPDTARNLEFIKKRELVFYQEITELKQLPQINSDDVVVDALFGSGFNRPLTGLGLETIQYLNRCPGDKIAIDIPSGLASEGIVEAGAAFIAHHTLTFQFPFLSFFFAENAVYTGQWHILDIGLDAEIINRLVSDYRFTEIPSLKIKSRSTFGHKGTFGHSLLIAGSSEMAGAAVLSSKACLRSGCGLVTVHTPKVVKNIVLTAFPEAIVSVSDSENNVANLPDMAKYSAIAIGPGIGTAPETK
jgi:ADP-dependent NAD(P)H-hydrate dehydratase / NAD(P)H-hydrate epimerase